MHCVDASIIIDLNLLCMKKLLILAVAIMLSIPIYALGPFQFGPYVGFTGTMIDTDDIDLNSRIGFTAGVIAKVNFKGKSGFYIESGAMLSLKGAEKGKNIFKPFYLDVPVHLGYGQKITNRLNIFASAGPTFSYGLWGKEELISSDVKLFKEDIFRRNDYSLGFKFGIEVDQSVKILAGYDWGQKNLLKTDAGKFESRMFQMGLAYLF